MGRIHTVKLGDRITNLSIKYYGTSEKTALIVNANPKIHGRPLSPENLPVIIPGDILNIPDEIVNIVNYPEIKTFPDKIESESNSIAFLIDGQIFQYFSEYDLNTSIDSFDNISFFVPQDENNILFKLKFESFRYKDIGIYYDKNLVFGGTLISVIPENNPDSSIYNLACYPKCAVINDCHFPDSLYPIEFKNQNLKQITNKLMQSFSISAIFDDEIGNNFKQVAPDPEQTGFDFFSKLAKQRGLLITNSPQGNLLFWKAKINSEIVANFKEGERPLISVIPEFDEQNYFSHITGFTPVKNTKDSEKYTWKNPFLLNILRPYNFIIEDSESGDLKKIVELKAGRMFGNVCNYTLTAQGHRDEKGNLYKKNLLINVYAPKSAIKKDTTFLIKNLNLNRSSDGGDTTTMNLVLPASYSGEIPKAVPWA